MKIFTENIAPGCVTVQGRSPPPPSPPLKVKPLKHQPAAPWAVVAAGPEGADPPGFALQEVSARKDES